MKHSVGASANPCAPYAPILALAALFAGGLFFTPSIFADPDTYWHLASGEWILRYRVIPTTDPFSWSSFGRPWSAHEWLSEILMALAFRAAGWSGIAILTGLAASATLAIVGVYLRMRLSAAVALIFVVFAAFGLSPSLLARPHILALPFLALWLIGLLEARSAGRTPRWWLLLLIGLWANLHASFILGLALIGPFAVEAALAPAEGRGRAMLAWAAFGLFALLSTLVNPQTWHGLLYPFQVMNMTALPSITEWRSTSFGEMTPFEAVLLEGLFFTLWIGVRVPALRLLVLLGFLHLAFSQIRQQIIFVVVAAVLLRDPFAAALEAWRGERPVSKLCPPESPAGAFAATLILLLAVGSRLALPLARAEDEVTPMAALAAVPPQLAAQHVLNGYNFGGYLIFKGVRPYIDGRADMYGDDFVAHYNSLRALPAVELASDLDRLNIQWTLLEPSDALVKRLDVLKGWRRLHTGRFAIVHVRSAGT